MSASQWVAICRCPPCLDQIVSFDPASGKSETVRVMIEITRSGHGKANFKIIDEKECRVQVLR